VRRFTVKVRLKLRDGEAILPCKCGWQGDFSILPYSESKPLFTPQNSGHFFAFRVASPCGILYPSARADAHGGGNKRTAGALPT
jgi:hypothetical protein